MSRHDALDVALVVAGHGRHYLIETPEGERLHAHPRGKRSECVVGDRVRWLPTSPGEGVIEHVEPRRNLLMRQDEWRSKSFAANIDLLLVLVAGEPMFSESQLARALVAAESAGIESIVGLNKADLEAVVAARERLAPYRAMGVDVLELSLRVRPADARETLWPRLEGKATLVLGPSGTGKSTLVNLFVRDAPAQVGEISRALNSGRHTTTTTQWYWLDAARTTALIDSPGFQEFGLHHIDPMQLAAYMPDLRPHVAACRFYNCTHLHEPGCGVRAAQVLGIESGSDAQGISASRYKIYSDLFAELRSGA